MITRDNLTIEQLQAHFDKIIFNSTRRPYQKHIRLTWPNEILQGERKVKIGQMIKSGTSKFIVLSANMKCIYFYRPEKNLVGDILLDHSEEFETTEEFASSAEIISAVFACSDLQKYLYNLNFDRYRLRHSDRFFHIDKSPRIGGGAESNVYKVEYANETLACKVLLRAYSDFSSELQMLGWLNNSLSSSKHLMTLKYFAIDEYGCEQLFFPYMELGELRQYLKPENSSYTYQSCYRILHHVICGVTVLHDMGVVHCDINPRNIFLTRGSTGDVDAKIGDFGLASFVHDMDGLRIVGSELFFAPELLRRYKLHEQVTKPEYNSNLTTDIYAYGITVYEAVVRHDVYPTVNDVNDLYRVVLEDGLSPEHDITTASHPPVSIKLISIFKRCAAFDVKSRPEAKAVKAEFDLGAEVMSDELRQFSPK